MATLTINGKKVTVDDSFLKLSPAEQEKTVNEIAAQMGMAPQPSPTGLDPRLQQAIDASQDQTPAGETFTSQGMSGVNEGIANFLSLPAALGNTLLSVGPRVSNLMFGTDFKDANWIPDPGKPALDLMQQTGAIKAPSADPNKQMVRRIGKEVGAAVPFGMLTGSALLPTLASSIGAGTGAAVAERVAPDNPWAELAGQIAGGFLGSSAYNFMKPDPGSMAVVKRDPINDWFAQNEPKADALKREMQAAYTRVDNLGIKYTPQSFQRLTNEMRAALNEAGLSPSFKGHENVRSFMDSVIKERMNAFANGYSLRDIDQLRQDIVEALVKGGSPAEQRFGLLLRDKLDDFLANASTSDTARILQVTPNGISAGSDPAEADAAIRAARELNQRFRKTQLIEDALANAERTTAATGSGGNLDNKVRQVFASLIRNGSQTRKAFTPDEIAAMEKVIRGGAGQDILRLIGKTSPTGSGLMAVIHAVASTSNPAMLPIPIAGAIAKSISDNATMNNALAARDLVAAGPRVPSLAAAMTGSTNYPLAATIGGAAANQTDDLKQRLRALRVMGL